MEDSIDGTLLYVMANLMRAPQAIAAPPAFQRLTPMVASR